MSVVRARLSPEALPPADDAEAIAAALAWVGLSRAELYDAFMGRLDEVDEVLDFLEREAPARRPLDVLDVGCGTGRLLAGLGVHLGGRVVGLEPDPGYAAAARARAPEAEVRVGGVGALSDEAGFDMVVMINGPFVYLPDAAARAQALANARRALRPGGVLVIDAPNFVRYLVDYSYPRVQREVVGGVRCRRQPRHAIDVDGGRWIHQDTLTLEAPDGRAASYTERFDFAILTAADLRASMAAAGFTAVTGFRAWDAARPGRCDGARLLAVGRVPSI